MSFWFGCCRSRNSKVTPRGEEIEKESSNNCLVNSMRRGERIPKSLQRSGAAEIVLLYSDKMDDNVSVTIGNQRWTFFFMKAHQHDKIHTFHALRVYCAYFFEESVETALNELLIKLFSILPDGTKFHAEIKDTRRDPSTLFNFRMASKIELVRLPEKN